MLWAGDQRRKLLANVGAYGGDVALVTITAPGRDVLPHREDGQVEERARWTWNRTAPRRWRALHRAAAQVARRRHGRFALVCSTWEYQRRGVLHRHVVLGVTTARELAAAHTYVQVLHDLREHYGYGFVDRGRAHGGRRSLEVVPAIRAARYVAKYLSPLDEHGKPTLSATVLQPDVPPHVSYVARTLTQRTGVTMRSLRLTRQLHCELRRTDGETSTLPLPDGRLAYLTAASPEALRLRRAGALLARPPDAPADALVGLVSAA